APRARWVVEQIPVESVTEHEDSFTAVIAADDPAWLDQLCLRLGDSILNIHPPSAAARVARRAADALSSYVGEAGCPVDNRMGRSVGGSHRGRARVLRVDRAPPVPQGAERLRPSPGEH